ncbi:MAG: YitT family protein [Johnsonella sp.]|nr:YitT family protein [Johnsonella sp.]
MDIKKEIRDYGVICFASIMIAFGIKNLYAPVGLVTGGFTGIGIILKSMTGIPLEVTNLVMNLPVFIISIRLKGWKFVQKSFAATIFLSLGFAIAPSVEIAKDDLLLCALFGAVLEGIGLGMVIATGATTGGTDMLAALIQRKLRHRSIIEIMQVINWTIVLAGLSVFGIRKALYALIAIFASTMSCDYIVEGFKFSKQAYIISERSDEIAEAILALDRGVTALHAKGMYSKVEKEVLFCVVSKKEIVKIKEIVRKIDPKAFVIVSDAREVFGEGFIQQSTQDV